MKNGLIVPVALFFAIAAFLFINVQYPAPSPRKHRGVQRPGRSGALEALDFWSRSRAYPNDDIPTDAYTRAYQAVAAERAHFGKGSRSTDRWEPIGPLNLQGRSLSVALNPLNPQTVYLGTASGGLWRSRTGGFGGDWIQVELGHPALGISAIAIDPTDTTIMYLGTGEVYKYLVSNGGLAVRTTRGSYGIGILKSTNAGLTWSKSLDWSYNQERGIQALKLNPLNPRTLWAATTEGIYKSIDAGTTWTNVLSVLLAQDVIIHSGDTNMVLVSCGNFRTFGTGIYRTTNGGLNWSPVGGFPFFSGKTLLAEYKSDPNRVFASVADSTTGIGSLWRTTNFGTNWTQVANSFTYDIFGVQGWYSHFVAVHPTDPSKLVHAAVDIVYSTNGGSSFLYSTGSYADHHGFAHHPTDPNVLYVVNDDGIYRSENFGASFTNVGAGLQTGQFYSGFSCSQQDSTIALVQSQDHIPGYRYTGSLMWDHTSAVDEVGWTAIDPTNDYFMYAINRFGQAIFASGDRGESFQYKAGFVGGSWNSPFVLAPSNPQILYVGNDYIFKSTDGANTWTTVNGANPLDVNPALSMAIARHSPDTVFVGTAPVYGRARVFRTTDGGDTWANVTGILPDRYPMDIAIDPSDSRIVYVAMGGFGPGRLFKSTDAGTNWINITGILPDVPTTAIAIDPLQTTNLYAGNDIGVFSSTDGGVTWADFSDGLPDAVIAADLTISPANRKLRIATHGNGAWQKKLLYEPASLRIVRSCSPVLPSPFRPDSTVDLLYCYRNTDIVTQEDTVGLDVRILDKTGSEIFYAEIRVCCLASGEERSYDLGTFTPPDTGFYQLQEIPFGLPDTVKRNFTVEYPASITRTSVFGFSSPYTDMTGGNPGPSGDDNTVSIRLPFTFTYDGLHYDSLTFSTNGWMEFGTADGLDPVLRLHRRENPSTGAGDNSQFLAGVFGGTENDLNKTISAWWDDLSTIAAVPGSTPPGEITYMTTGSIPDRIFIVQWKNIGAWYDDVGRDTRLNFQVKLYESSNVIDFHYGTIIAGQFQSSQGHIGASIGLKDVKGGSFHYYDVFQRSTGTIAFLRTDLSPLTDWPGPDSCLRLYGGSTSIMEGENLPTVYALHQNYPNPFNPTTSIGFNLPAAGHVQLTVFDITGRTVAIPANGWYAAGTYSIDLDASSFASGIYFYRLTSGRFHATRKMILVK